MQNYRLDKRTKQEFIKDIKNAHLCEAEIAVRLCILWQSRTGKWPKLEANGVDMSGDYISDSSKVNSNPDFKIDGNLMEITRSDTICSKPYFHLKTNKVNKALKDGFDFIFVNGFKESEEPLFIRITPAILNEVTRLATKKYGIVKHPGKTSGIINKEAYRYDISWFKDLWHKLPKLNNSIPKEYSLMLNIAK